MPPPFTSFPIPAINLPSFAGEVWIEDFGGVADWHGVGTGTDNSAAFAAALAAAGFSPSFESDSTYRKTIRFGVGAFYFASTIEILDDIVHLLGSGSASMFGIGATTLVFPANTRGIQLNSINTIGDTTRVGGTGRGAQGSIIENLALLGLGPLVGGAQTTAHGIKLRTFAYVRHVSLQGFAGDAINIVASGGSGGATEGNANQWKLQDISVLGTGRDGLRVDGNDVNGGHCVGFLTLGTFQGCGIRDSAPIGANTYIGVQLSGYGNNGVSFGGNQYVLIAEGLGGSTQPGTDNETVWYNIGAGGPSANFPTWVNGGTYLLSRPFWGLGDIVFICPYVEQLNGSICHLSVGKVIGGIVGTTHFTQHLFSDLPGGGTLWASHLGVGSKVQVQSGQPAFAITGGGMASWVGGPPYADTDFNLGGTVFGHYRIKDTGGTQPYVYEYNNTLGPDIYYSFQGTGNPLIWKVTTRLTTNTFGRATPQVDKFCLFDPVLQDPANPNVVGRVMGARSIIPSTLEPGVNHAAGEIYWNTVQSVAYPTGVGGILGWVCTVTGTPGTFLPITGIGGSTTVNGLPVASTVGAGIRAFVTDATATTFLSIVAGGGTNKVPVVSDGTNWLIG